MMCYCTRVDLSAAFDLRHVSVLFIWLRRHLRTTQQRLDLLVYDFLSERP